MKKVVFCVPGRQFSDRFLMSWSNMLINCPQMGILPLVRGAVMSNVYKVRNICLCGDKDKGRFQVPFQGLFDYDFIMWIDSDQVWAPEDMHKLFDHICARPDIDILSGVYKTSPLQDETTIAVDTDDGKSTRFVTTNEIATWKAPTKVVFTGFGFTIIRKGVFEKVPYPWFRPLAIVGEDGQLDNFTGEDIGFCVIAAENGFDTWVDPEVIVGHEKTVVY